MSDANRSASLVPPVASDGVDIALGLARSIAVEMAETAAQHAMVDFADVGRWAERLLWLIERAEDGHDAARIAQRPAA